MSLRHADPCDCGDPQHCGAFGCPCMVVYPDPTSPCGYEGCVDPDDETELVHCDRDCGRHTFDARGHRHVPTLCRCRHSIEVAP